MEEQSLAWASDGSYDCPWLSTSSDEISQKLAVLHLIMAAREHDEIIANNLSADGADLTMDSGVGIVRENTAASVEAPKPDAATAATGTGTLDITGAAANAGTSNETLEQPADLMQDLPVAPTMDLESMTHCLRVAQKPEQLEQMTPRYMLPERTSLTPVPRRVTPGPPEYERTSPWSEERYIQEDR